MRFRAQNAIAAVFCSVTLFLFVQIQRHTNDTQIETIEFRSQSENAIPKNCGCKSPKTGIIYNFCYQLPENPTKIGKRFDCKWVEDWEKIESAQKSSEIDLESAENGIPEPVFVTAFSDHFVHNGKRLIASIRKLGFKNRIVLYDLGIHKSNLEQLTKKACNLEIRNFNFSIYPQTVQNLRHYRWKPIVIAETLRDFRSIWYLDSSVIFEKLNVSHVYDLVSCHKTVKNRPPMLPSDVRDLRESREPHEDGWNRRVWERNLKECRKGQYLLHGYSGHGILSVTDPAVYTYFPTNPSQLKLKKAKMYDAGFVYAVNTRQTMLDIVKWYFLCALQEECMAPDGASLGCQFNGDDRFSEYAGCHRFDQSIINLVLANQFWYDRRYYVSEIVDFFHISRAGSPGSFDDSMGCL